MEQNGNRNKTGNIIHDNLKKIKLTFLFHRARPQLSGMEEERMTPNHGQAALSWARKLCSVLEFQD